MGESKISPHVAVITNIYTDHQDWHGSMEAYIEAKKNIFRYQKEDDYLILNIDNDIVRDFVGKAKSKVITYSLNDMSATYYMDNHMAVYKQEERIFDIQECVLEGEHNRYNILSAIAISEIYSISKEDIISVLKEFKGVHGRQELVRELNGVYYYNDTTATSVEAMRAMFERFGKKYEGKIIMIAGGVYKGLDYSLISDDIKRYLKSLILFQGDGSERIFESVKDFKNIHKYYNDMKDAVDMGYSQAKPGDMVILCPGASSFNLFANEFDRGEQFVKYVNLLK
jgi:UDP-N-acetylmuramoylalanine--D-glutamate ligase